jgi:delta(3,5)-delta(2,4)-dienoyl-CoA isomerase
MASNSGFQFFNVMFPREYVAHVEINRPNKGNSFVQLMWLEMRRVFDQLSHDPAVRAIVLSGAGDKCFSAGIDIQEAKTFLLPAEDSQGDPARIAVYMRRLIAEFQDCITAIERCEKPVVAAMHGYVLGLGVDLTTATDVRICSRDAIFSIKEVDIGLAADIGTLSRLPKVVGSAGWVKDVALTARNFGADEALRVGLVNSIHEDKAATVAAAIGMATMMASKSPVAVQGTKELLNWSRDHSVQDGLRYTAVWNSAAFQTADIPKSLLQQPFSKL